MRAVVDARDVRVGPLHSRLTIHVSVMVALALDDADDPAFWDDALTGVPEVYDVRTRRQLYT